jgi:uncharacterized membrane protein YgdD (TMEM256/DUF423 family)
VTWLALAFWLAALSVAAGAFGAHGLRARLEPADLALWETAARYLMYGALSLGLLGLAERRVAGGRSLAAPAILLLAGTCVFAGTVGALALGGPRWLGAVTPLGGASMIAGLAAAGWVGGRAARGSRG